VPLTTIAGVLSLSNEMATINGAATPELPLFPTTSVPVPVLKRPLPPSRAVTVNGYEPSANEAVVEIVRLVLREVTPFGVKCTGFGRKVAVAPAGSPEMLI